MLKLSYRNKLHFKHAVRTILLILLAVVLLGGFYMLYLQRYVVYSRDGARFDFSQTTDDIPLVETAADQSNPTPTQKVQIKYVDNTDGVFSSLRQLNGYYITRQMLQESPEAVQEKLESLTEVGTIMLDLKSPAGHFLYSTKITGAETADLDTRVVDSIISSLRSRGFTLIARIPAFADSAFALENTACALPIASGALWADANRNYWLDPANSLVLDYIQQICKELSSLGFSEVVFDDFYFPVSGEISYASSLTRTEIITQAASDLTNMFTGSNLTISFCVNGTPIPVENFAGRFYYADASGSGVESIVASAGSVVADPLTQIIFLSDSHDTRFDGYSILRPLIADDTPDPTGSEEN